MNDVAREELTDEAYQIKHVYALFGLASYQGQVLERGLANVLTVARTHVQEGTRDDFDAFLGKHLSLTMGQLLRLLGPHVADDTDLAADLHDALQIRNRLAHRFFREHELNFMSFVGREEMLGELMAAADMFEEMDARLSPVIRRFLNDRGMSEADQKQNFKQIYERLEAEAKGRDQA